MSETETISGPEAWMNWHAHRTGLPRRTESHPDAVVVRPLWREFVLSSDADIDNWLEVGPYEFIGLNPAGGAVLGQARRVLLLRVWDHIPDGPIPGDPIASDGMQVHHFTGGDAGDELAALVGLALGRRLRSGGMTRQGLPLKNHPLGLASEYQYREQVLQAPHRQPMLPGIAASASILDAKGLLGRYAGLDVTDAVTLVRAARQYGDALWVADADPRLAWIKLVGAVEAAAARRDDKRDDSLEAQLKRHDRKLYHAVKDNPEALRLVAEKFARTTRAEQKARSFVKAYAPEPPLARPVGDRWQFPWDELDGAISVIYNHRSRDLHDGIPFPPWLCSPPYRADGENVVVERFPVNVQEAGGEWSPEDLPMQLHTFAYIVGGALRKWWSDLPSADE